MRQVQAGKIQTPGQYVNLVSMVNALPDRLRMWTWEKLEQEMGNEPVKYLQQWYGSQEVTT